MLQKILIIIFINYSLSFAILGNKQQYAVITHNSPIYKTFADNTILNRIELGTPIISQNQRGARIQFEYNGKEVWIEQKNIGILDFHEKNFVDNPVLFTELSIANEKSINFVYDNKFYEIDLTDIQHLTPKYLMKIPNFSQLSASADRKMLLLTGDSTSNNQAILNLAFYDIKEKKFIPLTYFYGNKTTIENSVFSPDGRFLSLYFSIDDKKYTHVYDVKNKKLLLAKKDILNIAWYKSIFFIYTTKNIQCFDSNNDFKSTTLHTFDTKDHPISSGTIIGGEYFIDLDNKIYHFQDGQLHETSFRSLDRSARGNLEHYQRNNQFITLYKGQRLRSLSGQNPRWTFLSILNDEMLLYRVRKDALQILNVYNAIDGISYPYHWIEEPYYTFDNGISIEFATEGKEIWLFLEKPNDFAKIIRLPEMIK